MKLPQEVIDDLQHIRDDWEARHLLNVYVTCLVRARWRYKSIAEALNVSAQAISDRVRYAALGDTAEDSLAEYRQITGMLLLVPDAPKVLPRSRGKKGPPVRMPRPETIVRLKELQYAAQRYRGTDNNKKEAEMFVALIWYAHVSENASIYGIAKALGITHAGVHSRLVRYGYRTSDGGSSCYRQLTGRVPEQSGGGKRRTHCKRGHELSGDNVRRNGKKGDRTCRACSRMRAAEYYRRKKEQNSM